MTYLWYRIIIEEPHPWQWLDHWPSKHVAPHQRHCFLVLKTWNCDSPSTAGSRRLSESNQKTVVFSHDLWMPALCFPQHYLITSMDVAGPYCIRLPERESLKKRPESMVCELEQQIPEKMTAFGIESSLAQRFHLLSSRKNQKQQCRAQIAQ